MLTIIPGPQYYNRSCKYKNIGDIKNHDCNQTLFPEHKHICKTFYCLLHNSGKITLNIQGT